MTLPVLNPIRQWRAFGKSALVVAVTTGLAAAIHLGILLPWLGPPAPVLILVLAVLASTSYGGLWAGVAATLIAGVIAAVGLRTEGDLAGLGLARLGLLIIGCLIAAWVASALRRARQKSESARQSVAREVADRQLAQQRLFASEARFRELVESLPDIMFVADARGASRYANQRWFEFSGQTREQARQEHWIERVDGADRERVLSAWTLAVNTGMPFEVRCRLRSNEGDYRSFLVRARALQGTAGEPRQWFGVATDIDAQMRAEAALRDRDEQLRLALESTGLGVFEFEFWTRRIVWSDRCRAIWGFKPDETVTLRRIRDGIHPQDRRKAARALSSVRDPFGTGEFAFELRVLRPTGELRWVAARGCAFFVTTGDGDRAIRCIGTMLDFTERRAAEELVRVSEERFRMAAEAVDGIIYEHDVSSGSVLRTRGMSELLGYQPDQVPSTMEWWYSIVHPNDRARVRREQDHAAALGKVRAEFEYRVRHQLGHWVTLLDRAFMVRDNSGRLERVIGCAEDVTELRRVESSLREADRRKDEFLAILAHELRNPLAPMRNALDLMDASGQAETARYARNVLDRQLSHMVRLIDDLLDVARISSGKLTLQRSMVLLKSLVTHAVDSAGPLIRERRHQLRVDLPAETVEIHCDEARISQVLSNLLNNAARYTPPGGTIDLSARADAGEVVFEVKDNGVGIAPAALESIFEMFAQGGVTPAEGHSGLGVGLPLARSLVALHDGRLEVTSAGYGRGTTFTVRLPRPAVPIIASTMKSDHGELDVPAARRILVVDDNRDAADSLGEILRMAGHEIRVCHDGFHALMLAESFRPDMVLLDIGMPRIDGHEVARRLRIQPWGRHLRIIALSGFGRPDDRRRSIEAGCDDHLIKPVSAADLRRALAVPLVLNPLSLEAGSAAAPAR